MCLSYFFGLQPLTLSTKSSQSMTLTLFVSMELNLLTMLEQVINQSGWSVLREEDGVAVHLDSAKLSKIATSEAKLTLEARVSMLILLTIGMECSETSQTTISKIGPLFTSSIALGLVIKATKKILLATKTHFFTLEVIMQRRAC